MMHFYRRKIKRESGEQAFRYFLGEMSEAEQLAVEERFFGNADYSRFLDRAETNLISAYLNRKLDLDRETRFENHYLISQRRRELVRVLEKEIAQKQAKDFFFSFRLTDLARAGGVAVLSAITLGVFVFFNQPENKSTNSKLLLTTAKMPAPIIRQADKTSSVPLRANIVRTEKQPPDTSKVSSPRHFLSPIRQILPPTKTARKERASIRLRLAHPANPSFIKYKVEIYAADGDLLWSREIAVKAKTTSKMLALDVRRGALENGGSYQISLSGATADQKLEEISSYHFSVNKKDRQVFIVSDS